MNTNPHNTEHPDDLTFDRLVDGELSEDKRRDLLAGLDDEPGGWRRCALAFLEAQCFRQAVGQTFLSAQDGPGGRQECLPHPTLKRSAWPGRAGAVLAMAASFLVALGLVSLVQRARLGGVPSLGGAANQFAKNDDRQPPTPPSVPGGGSLAPGPWRVVTVSNGPGPGASFSLPAVERDNVDRQWLQGLPPAVPDDVLAALARTGHQIQQRRELIPVPLQDGRRLVVPVDQVEVHYVGNHTY
jgi:hypothetical protein